MPSALNEVRITQLTRPIQLTRPGSRNMLVAELTNDRLGTYCSSMDADVNRLPRTRLPAVRRELRLGASLLTPFDEKGQLDEGVLRQQIRRVSGAGLDLWIVSSGTAEGHVLTAAETDRIATLAVAEATGPSRVYAMGVEPRSAAQAIEFANRMQERGVDAVQVGPVEPGHSYSPTDTELRSFYAAVLEATSTPVILSSHVSAGYEIAPVTLARVADQFSERVVGLTATHLQNSSYIPRLLEAVGDRYPVWTGSPMRAIEACAQGVTGFTSSMDVNITPELYRTFADAWANADLVGVTNAYRPMLQLFQRVLGAGGLIIAKAILVRLGLPVGSTRPPRRSAGEAEYRIADDIIAEFALRPM